MSIDVKELTVSVVLYRFVLSGCFKIKKSFGAIKVMMIPTAAIIEEIHPTL